LEYLKTKCWGKYWDMDT